MKVSFFVSRRARGKVGNGWRRAFSACGFSKSAVPQILTKSCLKRVVAPCSNDLAVQITMVPQSCLEYAWKNLAVGDKRFIPWCRCLEIMEPFSVVTKKVGFTCWFVLKSQHLFSKGMYFLEASMFFLRLAWISLWPKSLELRMEK